LGETTVAAAAAILRPANADILPLGDLPNWRYPDPRVEVLDKRFKARIGMRRVRAVQSFQPSSIARTGAAA